MLDDYAASTAGWHNIGLRAGINAGVWLDGVKIMDYGVGLYVNEKVFFGTLTNTITWMDGQTPHTIQAPGIELYENLNYLRAYNRSQVELSDPPGGGHLGGGGGYPDPIYDPTQTVTDVTYYDNVQPVTKTEIIQTGENSAIETLMSDVEGDPTRVRYHFAEGEYTDFRLPNARRGTGLVVRDNADMMVAHEATGTLIVNPEENPMPGVAIRLHHGADGSVDAFVRTNPFCASNPDPRDSQTADYARAGTFLLKCTATQFGAGTPSPDEVDHPTSDPRMASEEPLITDLDETSETQRQAGSGPCACNDDNVADADMVAVGIDPNIGCLFDSKYSTYQDTNPGLLLCGEASSAPIWGKQHFEEVYKEVTGADGLKTKVLDKVFFTIGGSKYQLKSTAKDKDGLYDVNYANLTLIEGGDYMKASDQSDIEKWLSENFGSFGGSGGCKDAERDAEALETAAFVFDILGFVPVVGELADIASAGLSAAAGDYVAVALSLIAAALPVVGDIIAKPIKWAYKAGKKIAWGKFYDLVTKTLGEHCVDAGLKGKIQKALKDLRDYLNKGGLNLPAGWCFTAGTPVATNEGDKPIEELDVGDRVLTPETLNDRWTWTTVNPETWRVVVLSLPNPDCRWDIIRLRLLRPCEWLERHGIPGASRIWLSIDELGIHGHVTVHAVEACPPIKAGRGRVVTGTITHFNGFVKQLWFAGSDTPLCPTDVHPFYSTDRLAWVQAQHLQSGERVATATGTAIVERVGDLRGIHRVYNIEVERENCYFAGVQRALVHNSCSVDDFTQGWNAKQWQDAIDEFGDSAKWRFKKEKPGSGAKATSDNAPEGSTRVYEIWEGANGKEFEVHYFLDTNGVPSGHKMVERTK